ncbi:unnamed protein product [Rhodiola kirilowii]
MEHHRHQETHNTIMYIPTNLPTPYNQPRSPAATTASSGRKVIPNRTNSFPSTKPPILSIRATAPLKMLTEQPTRTRGTWDKDVIGEEEGRHGWMGRRVHAKGRGINRPWVGKNWPQWTSTREKVAQKGRKEVAADEDKGHIKEGIHRIQEISRVHV